MHHVHVGVLSWRGVCVTLSQRQPKACALSAMCAVRRDGKTPAWVQDAGVLAQGCNASTHGDEGKSAARVDRNVVGIGQTHERAGIPRGEIDTADAAVAEVLGQHAACAAVSRWPCGAAGWSRWVCAVRDATRVCRLGARTVTSAKLPLGSIAMPKGWLNRALVARPSLKPLVLPASVVVFPVGMSTRRTRWFVKSCKLGAQ